ncbi:MAG: hypothetical protein Q9166_002143 [cf. Caloplaca sp. 2 TL-2023]
MVVRAIRKTNPRARVNERHDIVLDPGPLLKDDQADPNDMYRTPFLFDNEALSPRKVSGSAGKASGGRALHHGTCLLASPNLLSISEYLRSPAEPFLKGGTVSVRSPVDNLISQAQAPSGLTTLDLQHHFIEAFIQTYDVNMNDVTLPGALNSTSTALKSNESCASGVVDGTLLEIPEIRSGYNEIQSPEWLYEQSPPFTLSSGACRDDERTRPPLPEWFPASARVYLKIKSGVIISSAISLSDSPEAMAAEQELFNSVLKGSRIIQIDSFRDFLQGRISLSGQKQDVCRVGTWLDVMLGKQIDLSFQ